MKIAYTSENKIYLLENGNKTEIPCGRIEKYKDAVDSIRRRSEWKKTGKGAQFMGAANDLPDTDNIAARICGLSADATRENAIIYSVALDESCAMYSRSTDRNDKNENLILSGNDISFGGIDMLDGKLAVSLGPNRNELHLSVMEPPSSAYTEYTDGDTKEEYPSWSRSVPDRIYFSTAGNARNEYGAVGAVSPRAGAYFDIEKGEMNEFLSDEKKDFLKIKDDKYGNIYYICQPYGGEHKEEGFKISDILFFPFRIIKALFGWLNFISTIWGGEPLKSGSNGLPGAYKTKDRGLRDIIIDGNVIKAERLSKESELKDGDMSGLMPLSRVLVKREADGTETVLKKGVLDYALCGDGKIIISNGRLITVLENGSEQRLAKAHLAMNLSVITE